MSHLVIWPVEGLDGRLVNGLGPDSESPGTPTGGSTKYFVVLFPVGGRSPPLSSGKKTDLKPTQRRISESTTLTHMLLCSLYSKLGYIVGTRQTLTNAANFEGRHPSNMGESGGL